MAGGTLFVHLSTLTRNPCFQIEEAHAEAMRTTLCPGCAHPRPEATAIDVWLQETRAPRDKPLNFLYGCGLGLIHRELLELLDSTAIARDLYLGRVFNRHRQECVDWRTVHGRRTVIVRGSKNAGYRTCDDCGRNIYHATGQLYLFPPPPPDATIWGSNYGGLIVPAERIQPIKAKNWRRLAFEELPVVDAPADGFGLLQYRAGNS